MMGAITLDVMNGHVPSVYRAIVQQRDLLPMGEASGNFDAGGGLGLTIRQTPAKNF